MYSALQACRPHSAVPAAAWRMDLRSSLPTPWRRGLPCCRTTYQGSTNHHPGSHTSSQPGHQGANRRRVLIPKRPTYPAGCIPVSQGWRHGRPLTPLPPGLCTPGPGGRPRPASPPIGSPTHYGVGPGAQHTMPAQRPQQHSQRPGRCCGGGDATALVPPGCAGLSNLRLHLTRALAPPPLAHHPPIRTASRDQASLPGMTYFPQHPLHQCTREMACTTHQVKIDPIQMALQRPRQLVRHPLAPRRAVGIHSGRVGASPVQHHAGARSVGSAHQRRVTVPSRCGQLAPVVPACCGKLVGERVTQRAAFAVDFLGCVGFTRLGCRTSFLYRGAWARALRGVHLRAVSRRTPHLS